MKIAVTRLEEKSGGTRELFSKYGHDAIIVPIMKTEIPDNPASLDELCRKLSSGKVDFLIFSSTMGVRYFFEQCASVPNTTTIIAVGPRTQEAVVDKGLNCETITSFSSDYFASYLGSRIQGRTVGIVRPDIPNTGLFESLTASGARVLEGVAYRLVATGNDFRQILPDVDAVIFTSGKSFNLARVSAGDVADKTVIAIGPKTASMMHDHGIVPDITGNGTLEGCLRALAGYSR
jgi:uroporphyrinogen-III synthase